MTRKPNKSHQALHLHPFVMRKMQANWSYKAIRINNRKQICQNNNYQLKKTKNTMANPKQCIYIFLYFLLWSSVMLSHRKCIPPPFRIIALHHPSSWRYKNLYRESCKRKIYHSRELWKSKRKRRDPYRFRIQHPGDSWRREFLLNLTSWCKHM